MMADGEQLQKTGKYTKQSEMKNTCCVANTYKQRKMVQGAQLTADVPCF